MRRWMLMAGMALALPAAANAAVLSGRVVRVDPEFDTMVLAEYGPLGNVTQWNLSWGDVSAPNAVLDHAPVGFHVSVSAEQTYFGTWNVLEVLSTPASPRQVVVEVVGINRSTGEVEVRDPVLSENHVVVLESYRLDALRPGGHVTMDLPYRLP